MITLLTKIKTVMLIVMPKEPIVMVASWTGVFIAEWLPIIHTISTEAAVIIPIVSAPVAVTTSILYFKKLYDKWNRGKA